MKSNALLQKRKRGKDEEELDISDNDSDDLYSDISEDGGLLSNNEDEDEDDIPELELEEDPELSAFIKPVKDLFDEEIVNRSEKFLLADPAVSAKLLDATKWMFDLAKLTEPFEMSPLQELLTQDFHMDQVWEQMQLRNKPMLKYLSARASEVISRGDIEPSRDLDREEFEANEEDEEFPDEDEEDALEIDQDNEEDEMELDDANGGFDDLDDDEDDNDEQGDEAEDVGEVNEDDEDNDTEGKDIQSRFGKGRRTELDDEFFSVHEMERFAERGEARDMKIGDGNNDDEDDWNLGVGFLNLDPDELDGSDEDEDDMNANDIKYDDYFLPPRTIESKKSNLKSNATSKKDHKLRFNEEVNERTFLKNEPASQFNDEDADEEIPSSGLKTSKDLFDLGDDEEDEDANRELSKFELEQKALADQIETLEAEAVAEKAWTMKGEVSGKVRPMNSLLEEDLEVEHASRPTPVITEETTKSLEDLIKSRIAESLFDDVERKIAPKEKSFDPNRRNIIDEQKSSKSLTDLYEQDYRKQAGATVKTAKDEAVENAHKEIDGLFKDLCMNLDALSNWHFTAKAPVAELEVVAAPSVPALSIEEVIPAVVSDAVLAAPKEVYAGDVGKSQAEMEKADKVKARNKQKRAFKKQRIERELDQKARGVLASGNVLDNTKKSKEKAMATLMKQQNVTIVADSKTGKGSAADVAALKSKGGKKGKAVKANVLERGGTIGKKDGKGTQMKSSQMLML